MVPSLRMYVLKCIRNLAAAANVREDDEEARAIGQKSLLRLLRMKPLQDAKWIAEWALENEG
eukprot:197103-Amorphochlora_amoeboformis.AAC.1